MLLKDLKSESERKAYRTMIGSTLLHLAAEYDSVRRMENLLHDNNFNPNVLNYDGETALISACRNRNVLSVKYLLEEGCDPNLITRFGDSPLLWSAFMGDVESFKHLVSKGADITHRYRDGRDIFLWAVFKGRKEFVSYILENIEGININIRDFSNKGWRELCEKSLVEKIVTNHIFNCKFILCLWVNKLSFEHLDIAILGLIYDFFE